MFIIKDTKYGHWLEIDRVVRSMDIVTTIDPVYNYKLATAFNSVEEVNHILEQIKSEGNYDTSYFKTENTEEIELMARKEAEEQAKKQEQEDK